MCIDQQLYLEEMDRLLAEAKLKLLAQSPDIEVYTISIWTDPNAAISAVNFDTRDNSEQHVQQVSEWNKSYHDKYMAERDEEMAALFRPVVGRNQSPADFRFSRIATVGHLSFIPGDRPTLLAGGDTPIDSPVWPVLESLLQTVQERARSVYRDLTLHPDARIAVNSPESWYDHEIPISA